MGTYNRVILVGNLTRDTETRFTAGGTAVASTGIAVNRRWKQNEETKEETCFVDIVLFGKQADGLAQYLTKGRQVLVEGYLRYRTWEDQNGQRRSKHEVVANTVQFLGPGRGQSDAAPSANDDQPPQQFDDIPF